MADLGICGLITVVLLFITPASIYLVYGMKCYSAMFYDNNYMDFCRNVNPDMAFILTVFGFIFLFCGIAMIGFTILVWWHDKNSLTENQKCFSEVEAYEPFPLFKHERRI